MVALCGATFFLWGVMLVILGASQADVARDLSLDLGQWGLLSAALPLGAGVGITAAGPLFDRIDRRRLFVGASALAGLVLSTVHDDMSFSGALARVALAGVGAGAYNTVINAALAEAYGQRSATPMMLVHATATLGATAGAPAVGWVSDTAHWTASFRALGLAHLAVALAAAWVTLPAARAGRPDGAEARRPIGALVPYLCAAFAYVGIEATATAFAVPYASGALGHPESRGRWAISALWLGVLTSRMLAVVMRRRLGRGAFVGAGALGALLVLAGTWSGFALVEIVFAAVGIAVGFVYPLLMTLIGRRFAEIRGTAAGLAGGAGAAGGFAVPWLTGVVAERAGIAAALSGLALWALAFGAAGLFMREVEPSRRAR